MWIKVCGVTTPEDALNAVNAGVDALGLNFVPSSARYIDVAAACQIVAAVRGKAELIGVIADRSLDDCEMLLRQTGVDSLQLHGGESPEFLESLLPRAFKAVGIATAKDVQHATCFGGGRLLVDAKVDGKSGGIGVPFDWTWVVELARNRSVIVAGGLGPHNVAQAVSAVWPYGVDVAGGVEMVGNKRRKDPEKIRAFVRAAREQRRSAESR